MKGRMAGGPVSERKKVVVRGITARKVGLQEVSVEKEKGDTVVRGSQHER
jgi:hypothetical protein